MALPEPALAYVLGTFPQASQTFIAREIRGLRQLGVPMLIFALKRRPADSLEAADRQWYGEVRFVPRVAMASVLSANLRLLWRDPALYLRTLTTLVALPHRPRLLALRAVALFMRGAWIAREIEQRGGCRQVHAHFALAQTEVAMAVGRLLSRPFSFTAHARDIYATPSALEEKMRAAAVVVTCTAYNVRYLRGLCPELEADHIQLVHHGVDAEAVPAAAASLCEPSGERDDAALIVAAGRLVDKKGFDTLIAACGELRARGTVFQCRIYGSGPLLARLRHQVEAAGLSDMVALPGWAPNDRLRREMGRAAVFAMASRVTEAGDRDGIPNVVLEAMAAGLPVVATRVSGIPEAVIHGETGLLVEPADPAALADALERVLQDQTLAASLGVAGRARVREEFALEVASGRLARLFGCAADLR